MLLLRNLALLAMLGVLAGCQHLSHPFEDDRPPTGSPLLTVPDTVGVTVAPITGAPDPTAHGLADAMAAALRDIEVPASTGHGNRHSYHLEASASVDPGAANVDHVVIRWTLSSFDGKEVGHRDQDVIVPATDWQSGGGSVVALAKPEAGELAKLLVAEAPAEHKPSRVLFVREVAGAPGDGNRALPSALSFLLKRRGIDLATGPGAKGTVTIAGEVAVTPADNGNDRVQISWHVLKPDGTDAGQIAQDNAVPHSSLDGRWGQVAMAVAMAGVDDILRVTQTIPETY